MDRRTRFFLCAAMAAFLMVPVGLEAFRDIAAVVGVVYLVLAVLSFADARNRG